MNENHLIADVENIVSNLKEIKELYELLKSKNYKLFIKDNLDYVYEKTSNDNRQVLMVLPYLKRLESIYTKDVEILNNNEIEPDAKENYYFIELASLCYRDSNELILSLNNEQDIINSEYLIKKTIKLRNVIGKSELEEFLIFNPAPQSIKEVFRKVGQEFEHIKFTDKAYKTADEKDNIYKRFGYNKILNVFRIVETLIYPFLKGDLKGYNQTSIEEEFKRQTNGVEFSHETEATMKKYGHEREVTIKGEKVKMIYHIKPGDNRIYFSYNANDDCIYVGHSGKHLRVVSRKK